MRIFAMQKSDFKNRGFNRNPGFFAADDAFQIDYKIGGDSF